MNKPNVYVDFDNVLCHFTLSHLKWINKKINLNLQLSDYKYYSWLHDIFGEVVSEFYQTEGCYDSIHPIEGSQEFIKELQKKWNVVIITSSYSELEYEKNKYIKNHFGIDKWIKKEDSHQCLWIENIIHTKDKYKYLGKNDIIIEDYPKNIYEHIYYNKGRGILFNHQGKYKWAKYSFLKNPFINQDNCKYTESYCEILEILNDKL